MKGCIWRLFMGWLTCATHIYGDHCVASRQKRGLELKVDEVDWAAICELLEWPAQPHAPHVSAQHNCGAEGCRLDRQVPFCCCMHACSSTQSVQDCIALRPGCTQFR